jgi:molecular chaperone DnaJ
MAITPEQGFRILGLSRGASLDEVKTSFRKLAFELHPDLNPNNKDAHRKFQELNEAYLILRRHLEGGPEPGPTAQPQGPPTSMRDAARKARQQARAREANRKRKQEQDKAKAYRASRREQEAGHRAYRAHASTSEAHADQAGHHQRRTHRSVSDPHRKADGFYFKQEEILRDIFRDSYARKVFEDIYSQVRKAGKSSSVNVPQVKKRRFELEWGDRRFSLDLSRGPVGMVKSWVKKQLDVEKTVHLPPYNLLPGSKVRIKIGGRLGKSERQIEIRLPGDYVIGRPMRLKGLGRRLGPVKGDLYLRLLVR